ncbi:MAG TPA: O-acetyl-ADP-ribose deacetylase [Chitinivibrionales bacterium]|nr:O-acetyl-ADP-ribose deacetylase [Chitinivibrionales bacterium]
MKIRIVTGDITKITCDAIVNAANSSLMGGGGVDGAVHRAGGPAILEECRRIVARQGGCPAGRAVITGGGNLPVKFVIHTVGPVWRGGHRDEPRLLASCYNSSLTLARSHGVKTIAFPAIATGVYGYPKVLAANVAHDAVMSHPGKENFDQIIFVFFNDGDRTIFKEAIKE